MTVRPVSAADVIDLRHRVLRDGLARELAIFEGDDEPTTIHLAAFDDAERIVGVVTILHRARDGVAAWQLRGMAVDATVQRGGVGAALLAAVDAIVATGDHSRELWCNARRLALGFYERHGWRIVSDEFDVPLAGPHRVMTKSLGVS